MRIGLSLGLLAVGAILAFAVTSQVNGVDLTTVGVVLMIVGGLGLVISLALAFAGNRRLPADPYSATTETTVYRETPTARY